MTGNPTGPATSDDRLEDVRWRLDFSAAKSVRYHAYRRAFWKSLDHWSKILSVISGTAVVVTALGKNPEVAGWLAIVVAVTSSADVVFGFGDRANRHDALYRDWCRFQEKLAELVRPTEEDIRAMQARRFRIEREEPTTLDWLERRCAAEECIARGCDVNPVWVLQPWQVWLSQWAMWPSARSP